MNTIYVLTLIYLGCIKYHQNFEENAFVLDV